MTSADKKNHLAIFLPSLAGGGAERVAVNLTQGFAAKGLDVDLVLAKAMGPYLSDVPPECRIVDLNAQRVLFALPGLIRYLRRERPEAMLSMLSHANIIAIIACILSRLKISLVVSERSALVEEKFSSWKGKIMKQLMRLLYPLSDAIVSVSDGVLFDIQRKLNIKEDILHTIYNPVSFEKIQNGISAPCPHDWLDGSIPVIIASGRLTQQKDFPTLLKAVAHVRTQRNVRLIILGEGEDRAQLENLADQLGLSEHVFFAGFVKNPHAWVCRASVFVLSSAWEGLPNALIETMACGTPVVSTDCPHGPAEILENGKWGRMVPVGDVQGMASAILRTLEEDSHPDIAFRASFFSLERAVDSYIKVLKLTH